MCVCWNIFPFKMCQIIGLLNVLGLILLSATTSAFRFPNEGRGRVMLRTNLVPPPPPPPRGIRHDISSRQLQHRPPGATTLGSGPVFQAPNGWRWPRPAQGTTRPRPAQGTTRPRPAQGTTRPRPAQGTTRPRPAQGTTRLGPSQDSSRHNKVPMYHQTSQRQPRKLQWAPPVRTLQQVLGTESMGRSLQQGTGTEVSSNHLSSLSLAPGVATELCQRCDLLNPTAVTACCSEQGLCCHQHTAQHSQSHFQQHPPQSYYLLQTPQVAQSQFHQQGNSHLQGYSQIPAHQIFHTSAVNIYNGQMHPLSHAEPAYDIGDPSYNPEAPHQEPDYTNEDYPTVDNFQQEGSEPVRDRRSSLGDLVAGAAISMISMAVRMAAEGSLGDENPQREHRMIS